jgi:ammonia channel protein AmtB
MNYARIVLATLASTVVYFILGALFFAGGPLKREFEKFPAVYRTPDTMKGVLPYGIAGMILSMLALSVLFAMLRPSESTLIQGLHFGALVGAFAVGSFVLHNYVNLNIGLRLTMGQAAAYFVQWVVVGVVIAWVYKPA